MCYKKLSFAEALNNKSDIVCINLWVKLTSTLPKISDNNYYVTVDQKELDLHRPYTIIKINDCGWTNPKKKV